jgi:hypothetical protein
MLAIPAETKVYCTSCNKHMATTRVPIVVGRDQIAAKMFHQDEGQFSKTKRSICVECDCSWVPSLFFLAIDLNSGQKSEAS